MGTNTAPPGVARFLWGADACQLLHWTAKEWREIPREEQPEGAFCNARGDHFLIETRADAKADNPSPAAR